MGVMGRRGKMVPTLGSSVYRQHIGSTTHRLRSRPVVVGAPYVLCVFVVGVVLLGVGTFVTAHGHMKDPPDPVLLVVGPALLALGGLLLLGSVVVCVVACCRNRSLREALSDDLYTIGASTFYDRNMLAHSEDEESQGHPGSYSGHHASVRGVANPAAPDHTEAVMILANTVAEERQRQASRKYHPRHLHDPLSSTPPDPHGRRFYLPHGSPYDGPLDHSSLDHLGLDRIHRADPHLDLLHAFDLTGPEEDPDYAVRGRAYSMSVRRPAAQLPPVQHRLRRNITFSPASRIRLQQQQEQQWQQQQHQQLQASNSLPEPPEQPQPEFQRKRSSRRKKGKVAPESAGGIKVHQLPKYDPNILRSLGLVSEGRPQLTRGMSTEGVLDHTRTQHQQQQQPFSPEAWQEDPSITYGSLGNPRRKPSVVMGVRGIRQQQQQAQQQAQQQETQQQQQQQASYTKRYPSSIYASDMELHRNLSMTSGLARSSEPRSPTPPTDSNLDCTAPDEMTSRTGSSPNLLLPPPDSSLPPSGLDSRYDDDRNSNERGDSDNSNNSSNRRERGLRIPSSSRRGGGTPSSLPSSPSLSTRPLSNISSESCHSDCCPEECDKDRDESNQTKCDEN